ncbi:MAG: hypothetical protein AB4038_12870 [Prochloraceae cyanobacterium]
MTTAQSFDTIKAENFAGMMLDILNHGAIALMTSIGHRTGLFDVCLALPKIKATIRLVSF